MWASNLLRRYSLVINSHLLRRWWVEGVNGWTRRRRHDLLTMLGTTVEDGLDMADCLVIPLKDDLTGWTVCSAATDHG